MCKNDYAIYVHIPFCKSRCGYCAFSSCTDYSLAEPYFEKLFAEMDLYSDRNAKISTVYIGGGTPSSVEGKWLDLLFERLRADFDLSNVTEITVECNPESVTERLLKLLRRNGVNRLSMGLQSVNDGTLKRIDRAHRYDDFLRALNLAHSNGFDNINADLILGLPESVEDFENSVKTVVTLPLTHVSVYALELHEKSPVYRLCKTEYNYDDDTLADMYDYAYNVLSANGFSRYETSNFCKAGFECRHNLNYWTEGRYFAFGASASGFVENVRFTNVYGIRDYIYCDLRALRQSSEVLSIGAQANEFIMLGLRLDNGVSLAEFRVRYGEDFWQFFANARKLKKQGFLQEKGGRVVIPPNKSYVANAILSELLNFED